LDVDIPLIYWYISSRLFTTQDLSIRKGRFLMGKYLKKLWPLFIVPAGFALYLDKPAKVKLRLKNVRKMPDEKTVRIELEQYRSDYDYWADCQIVIDKEKQEILFDYSSTHLFDKQHKGSGQMGVILFSLPFIILSSPVLLPLKKHYEKQEKLRGMSNHSHAVLKALKGQLDQETEELLIAAMKNSWEFDQEMDRELNFEEAQEFLGQQHLTRQDDMNGGVQAFWLDNEKNNVALGTYNPFVGGFSVRVLGSEFEKEKAEALLECYKTIEIQKPKERNKKIK